MSKNQFRTFNNRSEKPEMPFTAATARDASRDEMQQHVKAVVALAPQDNRKSALSFAAKALRLPFGRVRELFYGNARRIEAHEADQIRAYVIAAQELMEARADYEARRKEFLGGATPFMARLAPPALSQETAKTSVPPAGVK
jgi:hypothetical protein